MASTEYHGKYKKLFPGVLSSNSFLTVYILHLLDKKKDMYGKEIVDSIGDRLNGTWQPSHGLVYPLLRNLESLNLIVGLWEDGDKKTKRYYRITPEGQKVLQDEAQKIEPMFREARLMIDSATQDLYGRVMA